MLLIKTCWEMGERPYSFCRAHRGPDDIADDGGHVSSSDAAADRARSGGAVRADSNRPGGAGRADRPSRSPRRLAADRSDADRRTASPVTLEGLIQEADPSVMVADLVVLLRLRKVHNSFEGNVV